jgi:hypothetical protein
MPNAKMPRGGVDSLQVLQDLNLTQSVSIAVGSAACTTAFVSNVVRIAVIGADTCITFAAAPTAVTTDLLMPAGSVEYFHVDPGQKVAGISQDGATTGTLVVAEMG